MPKLIRFPLLPLHGILAIVFSAVAGGPSPLAASQTSSVAIVIWKVGSPYSNDVPAGAAPEDLRAQARKAGLDMRIRTFPAKGFYEVFTEAVANGTGPDILAIDNFGILEGAEETPAGPIRGILQGERVRVALENVLAVMDSLEPPPVRGWVFLVRGSAHHAETRDFVLRMAESGSAPTDVRGSLDPDEQVDGSCEELHNGPSCECRHAALTTNHALAGRMACRRRRCS